MAKKHFEDPLEDIDPIMARAFSVSKNNDTEEKGEEKNEKQDSSNDFELTDDDDELLTEPIDIEDTVYSKKNEDYGKPSQNIEYGVTAEPSSPQENHETLEEPGALNISDVEFPEFQETPQNMTKVPLDIFGNISINLSVELGRSNISLKEVYELTEGSIIELERLVGEPLDLVVSGQVIAQGEVVAIDNNYGLRVTSITASPQHIH